MIGSLKYCAAISLLTTRNETDFMLTDFAFMFWKHGIRPTAVVHCGAHRGQEAGFYDKYCAGPVYWIEALPKIHASLVKNIAPHPRQRAFCACLSDADGEKVTFRAASNDGMSSSFLEFGTHARHHPDVKWVGSIELTTTRLWKLFFDNNVEIPAGAFLNVDTQGADLKVMRGAGNLLDQFDYIHCEVNNDEVYKSCARVEEVDAYLTTFGFYRVETWWFKDAGWGDALFLRKDHWSRGFIRQLDPMTDAQRQEIIREIHGAYCKYYGIDHRSANDAMPMLE